MSKLGSVGYGVRKALLNVFGPARLDDAHDPTMKLEREQADSAQATDTPPVPPSPPQPPVPPAPPSPMTPPVPPAAPEPTTPPPPVTSTGSATGAPQVPSSSTFAANAPGPTAAAGSPGDVATAPDGRPAPSDPDSDAPVSDPFATPAGAAREDRHGLDENQDAEGEGRAALSDFPTGPEAEAQLDTGRRPPGVEQAEEAHQGSDERL